MDEAPEEPDARFRSPARILIPTLVQSRDKWKAKANHRNRALKNAQVRIRDLVISRERWNQRFQEADQQIRLLQEQLQQTQRLLEQSRSELAPLVEEDKKNGFKPS